MAYYFKHFPKIQYDMFGTNMPQEIHNIMISYKIEEILSDKTSIYYIYSIKDSDRPDIIAEKYFEDGKLDWLIYVTNKIINPNWDWQLN